MAGRLATSLLTLALAASSSLACKTDMDCSLNGVCSTPLSGGKKKACVCDKGWLGDDCGVLDVRPAAPHSGYNRTGEGISSWCNRVLQDPVEKNLYHLIAAEFTHHCGLNNWSPYSRIIRAESHHPMGPYKFAEEIVEHFAHNPTVVWSPADKQYLLYYIGCKQNVSDTCTDPNFTCGPGNYINGESGISVATSKNIYDWKKHGQVMLGDDGTNWDADVTNPAPFPLYGNGDESDAMLLVYRGCPLNCSADFERINVASSFSGWKGPYTKLSPNWLFIDSNEDPYVWRDKRNNWHMLLHSLEADGGFGSGPKVGRHAYAQQWEGPWHFVNTSLAFNTTVQYTDGTTINFSRRERPNLFFSDDGEMTPLFLGTGVQEVGSGQSYSVIVPVGADGANYK